MRHILSKIAGRTLVIILLTGWGQPVLSAVNIQENSRSVSLSWSLEHYSTELCTISGQVYALYRFADCGFTVEEGRPQLPLAKVLFPLPDGVTDIYPELTRQEDESIPTDPVLPNYQRHVQGTGEPRYTFLQDPAVYEQAAWYPQKQITWEIITIRDRRYAAVRLYPFLFHPLQNRLKVVSRLEYKLHFITGRMKTAAPASQSVPWVPDGGSYYKSRVNQAGLYRISYTQLAAAGVDPGSINPVHLRLFKKGLEQSILVSGEADSSFDSTDHILFYGEASADSSILCDYYTDENVYWLEINGDSAGLRSRQTDSVAGPAQAVTQTVARFHGEKDSLTYTNREDSITLTYYWKKIAYPPRTENIPFILSYPVLTDSVTLTVKFRGMTSVAGVDPDHHLRFKINSQALADQYSDGNGIIMYRVSFPASYLQADTNMLQIHLPGDTPAGEVDGLYLDWFRLEYRKHLAARQDRIRIQAIPDSTFVIQEFVVDSMTVDSVLIWRLPDNAVIRDYRIQAQGSRYRLQFKDSVTTQYDYLVIGQGQEDTVLALTPDTVGNLDMTGKQYDHIIITRADLYQQAAVLKSWREQYNSFSVLIADIDEIMDGFNYGIFNPTAIHSFLKHAYETCLDPKPQYAVFLGDASWDYKQAEYSKENVVPSLGNPANDNYFACVSGPDFLPDLYVGRLPAADAAEAATMVDKIIAYESDSTGGEWRGSFVFLNGGQNAGERASFLANTNNIVANCISPTDYYNTVRIINKELDDCVWDENLDSILAAFNRGALWVNFAGHGGSWTWDCMVSHTNVQDIHNSTMLPFVTSMTCHTGRFAEPYLECFGETFMEESGNGAMAFLGTTGWGYILGDYYLSRNIYTAILQKGYLDLGRAIADAKVNLYASFGSTYRELIENYTLLGDPAVRLKIPGKPDLLPDTAVFAFTPGSPYEGNEVEIRYGVVNYGLVCSSSISVSVYHDSPGSQSNLIDRKTVHALQLDTTLVTTWLPPDTKDSYDIYIVVDDGDSVAEFDEANNSMVQTLTVYSQPVIAIRPFNKGREPLVPELVVGSSVYSDDTLVYYFELDTNIHFNSPFKRTSGPVPSTVNFAVWDPGSLMTDQTYFWHARVYNGNQYSQWSDHLSFSVQANSTGYTWGESHPVQFLTDSVDKFITIDEGLYLKEEADTIDIARYDSGAIVSWVSSQVYHTDRRNLIGGAFDITVTSEAENFIFGGPDSNQRAIVDLGREYPIKKVASHHYGGLGDREVWSYFSVSTSTDSAAWELWGDEGPFTTPDNNISDNVSYEKGNAIPARYLLYNYGINSPDYGGSGSRIVEVCAYQGAYPGQGGVLSSAIGPSLKWDSLTVSAQHDSQTQVSLGLVGYLQAGGVWEPVPGFDSITAGQLDLSGVDANEYPFIKLNGTLMTGDRYQTPVLKEWSVSYQPAGELILSSFSLPPDTIKPGDTATVRWSVHNQGYAEVDSGRVRLQVKGDSLVKTLLDTSVVMEVNGAEVMHCQWVPDDAGLYQFNLVLNPDTTCPEFYYGNNHASKTITVYDVTRVNASEIAGAVRLQQVHCYPHPVKSDVSIGFTVDQQLPVVCRILDSRGQVVMVLNRTAHAGPNLLRWDGRGYNGDRRDPGIYYISIRAGKTTGLMAILKLE